MRLLVTTPSQVVSTKWSHMSDSSPTAAGLLTATSTDVHWRRSDSDSECLIPVVPPKFSDKLNVRADKFTLPTMCLRTILVAILPAN